MHAYMHRNQHADFKGQTDNIFTTVDFLLTKIKSIEPYIMVFGSFG